MVLKKHLCRVHFYLNGVGRKRLLSKTAMDDVTEVVPAERAIQTIQGICEPNQTIVAITAVIVMNHDQRRLAEKNIKRKIFYTFPWVSTREYRETAVTHNGWRP